MPAINAAAALQQALEVRARRQVWRRREPELCRPEPEEDPAEPLEPPGSRPAALPRGPIETYRARLGPTALGGAVGLLPLTRRPGRSADLLKALTPKAALLGRESFAAAADLLLCRRDVLPMDGSAYRRLDRIDAVVVDPGALCTGPPVVIEAQADADGWDTAAVWTAAARLLGIGRRSPEHGDGGAAAARTAAGVAGRPGRRRCAPSAGPPPGRGGDGRRRAGPARRGAAHRRHRGRPPAGPLAARRARGRSPGRPTRWRPPDEPLADTVRRLQTEGRGVLVVSAADGPALLAADVGVAPVREGRARPGVPTW